MSALFAESFAEAASEPSGVTSPSRYDEDLAQNVLPSGEVFVECALSGETATSTKAAGENDDVDFDDEDTTITEASGEYDGWLLARTTTRTSVRGEADDWHE